MFSALLISWTRWELKGMDTARGIEKAAWPDILGMELKPGVYLCLVGYLYVFYNDTRQAASKNQKVIRIPRPGVKLDRVDILMEGGN
jgi:hypothetical protein